MEQRLYRPTLKVAWQDTPTDDAVYIYLIPQKQFLLLDGVAIDIWHYVVAGLNYGELLRRICNDYSISEGEVQKDIDETLFYLLKEEVIYVVS